MKAGFLSQAIMVLMLFSMTAGADTIYFKDGTSIDCLIHQEKEIWKEIDDPNFYEIEVYGGYVGFWDNGQVERIEYNDDYVPPTSDTQEFIRQLISEGQMILPTGITDAGGMIFNEQVEKPTTMNVAGVRNWVFVRDVGIEQRVRVEEEMEIRRDQILTTARNSRATITLGETLRGGLKGGSSLKVLRLNHADHLATYECDVELQKGEAFFDVSPRRISQDIAETVKMQINGCMFTAGESLLHCIMLPDEAFRLSLLKGGPLEVRLRLHGTNTSSDLQEGETLVVPEQRGESLERVPAEADLAGQWQNWGGWTPKEIEPFTVLCEGKPVSEPIYEELAAFGGGSFGWEEQLMASPMAASLPTVLERYRQALKTYREKNGQYPEQEQGLRILHETPSDKQQQDPYGVQSLPKTDPWGNPFIFEIAETTIEEGTTEMVLVRSRGPNGRDEKGLGDDIQ